MTTEDDCVKIRTISDPLIPAIVVRPETRAVDHTITV